MGCLANILLNNEMVFNYINKNIFIRGMTENIYEQMELSEAIYQYLCYHSKYTQLLSQRPFLPSQYGLFL